MSPTPLGGSFPTLIPDYSDDADIQAAFIRYHKGTEGSNIKDGVEKHLLDINTKVSVLEALGIGASYDPNPPTLPVGETPPDGFIWVDADAPASSLPNGGVAIVSATPPNSNLVYGLLWIDTANAFKLKFYDNTVIPAQWRPTT